MQVINRIDAGLAWRIATARADRMCTAVSDMSLRLLKDLTSKKATAYHEAGHAVIHEALGFNCERLELFKPKQAERYGASGWCTAPRLANGYSTAVPEEDKVADACAGLGGYAGECLLPDAEPRFLQVTNADELVEAELILATAGRHELFDMLLVSLPEVIRCWKDVHVNLVRKLLSDRVVGKKDIERIVRPIRDEIPRRQDLTGYKLSVPEERSVLNRFALKPDGSIVEMEG